jgi:antitoxin VapB
MDSSLEGDVALNIESPEAARLAEELAHATGKNVAEVVTDALRSEAEAVRRRLGAEAAASAVEEIQAFVASLSVRDGRSPEELLGYDDFGLPG